MRLTNLIFAIGVTASVAYVISLLFRMMHWPFGREIGYVAYALIVVGLILYVIDWYKYRRKHPSQQKQDEDDWDDV
jgi:undecaprenyl pyrophosphate phosphatase UppP